MSSLKERCLAFYRQQGTNAMMRTGDPVSDLLAFVVAETGRKADPVLDQGLPVCLYFDNDEDRKEFVQIMREAKPGMVMKKLP